MLRDRLLFHEYFNGDDGGGLGASHQTGWTGLVADILARRAGAPRRAPRVALSQRVGRPREA